MVVILWPKTSKIQSTYSLMNWIFFLVWTGFLQATQAVKIQFKLGKKIIKLEISNWRISKKSSSGGLCHSKNFSLKNEILTAIPYRASTRPEQGFPCVVNYHKEKPVFIVRITTQGNPCSHYRERVYSAIMIMKKASAKNKFPFIIKDTMVEMIHNQF